MCGVCVQVAKYCRCIFLGHGRSGEMLQGLLHCTGSPTGLRGGLVCMCSVGIAPCKALLKVLRYGVSLARFSVQVMLQKALRGDRLQPDHGESAYPNTEGVMSGYDLCMTV